MTTQIKNAFVLGDLELPGFPSQPRQVLEDLTDALIRVQDDLNRLPAGGFKCLQDACQTSRMFWSELQDAYLFFSDCAEVKVRYFKILDSFVVLIQEQKSVINETVESCRETKDRDHAVAYRESIDKRWMWAKALRDDGLVGVFREFLNYSRPGNVFDAEMLRPSLFHAASNRSVSLTRLLFVRNALTWLIHKSAFIRAELGQEHGPYLASSVVHCSIAERISACLQAIQKASEVRNVLSLLHIEDSSQAGQSDDAEPFLRMLGRIIRLLDSKIVTPLRDLSDETNPDHCNQNLEELAQDRINKCQADIQSILFYSEWALEEFDNRDKLRVNDGTKLRMQILLYPEKGRQQKTVAHCLNFDLVTSASSESAALVQIKDLIDDQLLDWKQSAIEYMKPTPAPFEYLEAWFIAGEKNPSELSSKSWFGSLRSLAEHPHSRSTTLSNGN